MGRTSSLLEPSMAHRMTFESPDTLCIDLIGPLNSAEAHAIIARIHELGREHGPMYWLIDVSRFSSSGERVRDIFLKGGSQRYPILAGVMCGAPFAIRVATMMVLTAGARILPKSFSFPFDFTATADEARNWISAKRTAMTIQTDRRELYVAGE
jgi:hypothetical protein